jgi:hypothetical protein
MEELLRVTIAGQEPHLMDIYLENEPSKPLHVQIVVSMDKSRLKGGIEDYRVEVIGIAIDLLETAYRSQQRAAERRKNISA